MSVIPFSVTLPVDVPARDEMTKAEFDRMMAIGLQQAKADDSFRSGESRNGGGAGGHAPAEHS